MTAITLIQAINQAMAYALDNDPNTVIFGEDVGSNGGVFRATDGLQDRFGANRVVDTPLAESMIAGMAIGMSSYGLKPIAEFQFMGFIYPAFNQIVSHAAKLRNRTRSRLHCPIVFRAPYGGFIHAPEHHSESTEALFAHIPGLRIVIPSTPARGYGLFLAALQDPDPVLFLEPKRIYRAVKQDVPDNGKALPLDTAFLVREGKDITLISWGASMQETLQSAETLAKEGIEADVIDLASISPIDMDTLLRSVEKTGRCVIVHEAAKEGGVGANIAARLAEEGLFHLRAPIVRVTGYDTHMPYLTLEKTYMPSVKRIVTQAKTLMEFS